MAGRAGRRGIDTHGYVVHCCNLFQTMPTANDYRELLSGKPQQLVSKFGISYNLVLNLLKSGGSLSVEDCCVFVNQSMRRQDMDQVLTQRKAQLNSKSFEREKMRTALETTMKTPMQVCLVYLDMERALPFAVNKKRKALDRDMKLMAEQHSTCVADVQRVRAFQVLDFEVQQILAEMTHLQAYMLHQMQRVCLLLQLEGFLDSLDNDNKFSLATPLGTAAAGLAEIHPLIMARVLCDSNWFNDVGDVAQLVGILSCFTDVKVQDRLERPAVHGDAVVQKYATQFLAEYHRLYALEEDAQLTTSEVALNFDLIEWAMRWAGDSDDEIACRIFLMELQGQLGVSAGDFTKAMLKISTVVKELSGIASAHAQTECLHKLSRVDAAILKYVATNQSLYV
jgi:superfamily II RNA helicase